MVIPDGRTYVIINASDVASIDFSQVSESSSSSVRYRLDGLKAVIKYDGSMPSSVSALTDKSKEYTHDEILVIMANSEWQLPDDGTV